MIKLIRWLVGIYQSSPIKPFPGILQKLYAKYRLLNSNKVVITQANGIK